VNVLALTIDVFPQGSGWLTKVGLIGIAAFGTFLVVRILPPKHRPSGRLVPALAVLAAFTAIRFGADSGFNEWLDHDVFEKVGGETDDFPTYLVAMVAAGVVLVVARWRR
jgi:hypothetical protein